MTSKRKTLLVLVGLAMIGTMMLASAVPTLAQQGPEIRVTNSATFDSEQPDVAIDSNGNMHIVYSEFAAGGYREIWYTMLDKDGNTLIDDTRITPDDDNDSTRPAIGIDSTNKVHIIWRDWRWDGGNSHEVTYSKLDPYLDDMNGNAANPATITLIDDKRLTDIGDWYIYNVRMAIASNDDIHIVWDDQSPDKDIGDYYGYVYYMKIDKDGNELIPETLLRDDVWMWRALPDVALDSNDNVHITWAEFNVTNVDEVYYMMLDGSDGSIMIDATLITADDGEYSKWSSIAVDNEDKVHIVFQDARDSAHEIWYTKLDPSLDDQSGDAANDGTITLIPEKRLTSDDGDISRHPTIAISCGRYIHVAWEEYDSGDIHYMLLDRDGNVVIHNTPLTTSGTVQPYTYWTMPYIDVDTNGKAYIVWGDWRDGGSNEIYYTTYQGPLCVGAITGTKGPEIRVTNSATFDSEQPDVAIDSNGNMHIVYSEFAAADGFREIWYTMLDKDGNTLIDDTRITPDDDNDSTRPQIVIDSSNKVHIIWRDWRWDGGNSHEVTYSKLDPYLDDMDGSAADPATITLIDDKRMTNLGISVEGLQVRMAIDSNDAIHIVYTEYNASDVWYMKIDKNGNELISQTVIRDADYAWKAYPGVALDSNDNVHIIWADGDVTLSDEVYYMMLDGSDGSIMIDATLITADDGDYSKWASITVDNEDKVHIVFQDARDSTHEIWYTKLDPSLDDQSGDAANDGTITLIPEKRLTSDDGYLSRHPTVAISCGRYIHVAWEEYDFADIHYMLLDKDGSVVIYNTPLTTSGAAEPYTYWTMPYMDVDTNGKAYIVWGDSRDGGSNEIYYTTYQGPLCVATITGTNCTISDLTVPDMPAGAPADFTGDTIVGFTATGFPDTTADLSITFTSLSANPMIYKVVNGTWIKIYPTNDSAGITNVSLIGNTLSYTIEDGSDCDVDGIVDGTIQDPVVVGAGGGTGGDSSGGSSSNNGGICFIATADYGSPLTLDIKVLREFRDRIILLVNRVGRYFVDLYYFYSPPVADFIASHSSLRTMVRWSLLPFVGVSWVALKIGLAPTLAFVFVILTLMSSASIVLFSKRRRVIN